MARPDCLWLCLQQAQEGMLAQAKGSLYCDCGSPTPTPTPFPYGPKGVADPWQNWEPPKQGTNLNALDFDWYYDWTFTYVPERENDSRYVRMVWCKKTAGTDRYGVTHTITEMAQEDFDNGRRGRVWLIFNEPDHPIAECGNQTIPGGGGVKVSDPTAGAQWAAQRFSEIYDMIKGTEGNPIDPYARVFGGGLVFLNTNRARQWWQTFVNTLSTLDGQNQLYKLEGVHIHLYALTSTSTYENGVSERACYDNDHTGHLCMSRLAQVGNNWYQDMHIGLDLGDRPIWVTEAGWLGCELTDDPVWIRNNIMTPTSWWYSNDPDWYSDFPGVPGNPGYWTMTWYSTYDGVTYPCGNLLNSRGPGGQPIVLGDYWNTYQP